MGQHVLLNNVDHHDLRLISRRDATLGDSVNQTLVFPSEFSEIQRHYPIFFQRTENGGFKSVALLGFDKDENLFLEEDRWNAAYIPALQKIGPFLIGEPKAEDGHALPDDAAAMILIDVDHPRISTSEGDPLFLAHGGQSPALLAVQASIQTVYLGSKTSERMFSLFQTFGLISPIKIDIQLNDRKSVLLENFYTINQDAFRALSGDQLKILNESNLLTLAIFVMCSMSNLSNLVSMKNKLELSAQFA